MRKIIISNEECNQRVDRFLLKYLNLSTRANVYRIIRKKLIKINGAPISENTHLHVNDEITLFLNENTLNRLIQSKPKTIPVSAAIDIVFENDDLLVINKPSGLLTHPDKNEYKKTLTAYVHTYLSNGISRRFKPAPIHRLDKNTSGLVVFCKNYESLKMYNQLMRERKIEKYYHCIVHGCIKNSGAIKGYLRKNENRNTVFVSSNKNHEYALPIHTKYTPLLLKDRYTFLEIELVTGRSHQIRASLAHIHRPILGDTKYGGKKTLKITTQLLHASKIHINSMTFEKKNNLLTEVWDRL